MPSRPIYRVEYATSAWKCGRKKCKVNGGQRQIHIGELAWVRNDTRRHWQCVSGKNRKTMKLHVPGERYLNGLSGLLLKDTLRVVKDMGWGNVDQSNDIGTSSTLGQTASEVYQQSSSESEDDVFQYGQTNIGAQNPGSYPDNRDAYHMYNIELASAHIASQKAHFEPIISSPSGPLPPLDFRFKAPVPMPSHTNIDISAKISSYKENPTSIIGKKFRFNDGDRNWEALEIVFGKKGWETVTVEGQDESHKFDFEVLLSMLKHGVLDEA